MQKTLQPQPLQPRYLRYRSHYRVYLMFMLTVAGMILGFWAWRISVENWHKLYETSSLEIHLSLAYFFFLESLYVFWLKNKLNQSVQVYPTHISIHKQGQIQEIKFEDIVSWSVVCWSIFYFKTKDGYKHYFNCSLERIDYIWEGFKNARPDLISREEYESFRLVLVQYDHHQKRKEWFFKHKMVDIFNWVILPVTFLGIAYAVQSKNVIIYQQGLYFFRLFMYALLVLLLTTFLYSILLKRLIFDRKIEQQMQEHPGDKIRDLEFEGVILQRSKIFQMITACFLFVLVVRTDMNFYSVTKIREDLSHFNLKKGYSLLVDNRYNCINCPFSVKDGDLVLFGRGSIGQVMAKEGEMVGEVGQDQSGRMIASDNIHEVPEGHIAVKSSNGKDIMFVKINDLLGKLER